MSREFAAIGGDGLQVIDLLLNTLRVLSSKFFVATALDFGLAWNSMSVPVVNRYLGNLSPVAYLSWLPWLCQLCAELAQGYSFSLSACFPHDFE